MKIEVTNCQNCQLRGCYVDSDQLYCRITKIDIDEDDSIHKPDWCPLLTEPITVEINLKNSGKS